MGDVSNTNAGDSDPSYAQPIAVHPDHTGHAGAQDVRIHTDDGRVFIDGNHYGAQGRQAANTPRPLYPQNKMGGWAGNTGDATGGSADDARNNGMDY